MDALREQQLEEFEIVLNLKDRIERLDKLYGTLIERVGFEMRNHPLKFVGVQLGYPQVRMMYTGVIVALTTLASRGIKFEFS